MSYFVNYSPCDVCPSYCGDCCDDCDMVKRHIQLMKVFAEDSVNEEKDGNEL